MFYSQLRDQLGEGFGRESFSKYISTLFSRADINVRQNLSIQFLFNIKAININMFDLIMIDRIMSNAYRKLIIIEYSDRLFKRNLQLLENSLNPEDFINPARQL